MSNPGLGAHLHKVKNSNSCGLTSSPGGGWDCDEGSKRARHRLPLANGRIDVFQKICWITGVERRGFGRVHGRTPTHCDEAFKVPARCKGNGVLKGLVTGFSTHPIIE